MKRKVTILLCILLCVSLALTSCVITQPEESIDDDLPSAVSTEVSDEMSESDASEVSEEVSDDVSSPDEPAEDDDFFTANGQGKLPSPAKLPKRCTPTETTFLYKYNIDLPEISADNDYMGADVRIEITGDLVMVYDWNGTGNYAVYTSDGTKISSGTLPAARRCVSLREDGSIYCATLDMSEESGRAELIFIDRSGHSATMLSIVNVCDSSITQSGKYFAVVRGDWSVNIYKTETCKLTRTIPAVLTGYPYLTASEDGFVLTQENGSATIDAATGVCRPIDDSMFVSEVYDGLCCSYRNGGIMLWDGKKDTNNCFIPYRDEWEYTMFVRCGWMAAMSYGGENCLNIYDLRSATLDFSIPFDTDLYFINSRLDEATGRMYIVTVIAGNTEVYLFDLASAALSAHDTTEINVMIGSETDISAILSDLAQKIYDETGVTIVYGSEGNDFIIPGYVGVASTEYYGIFSALTDIRKVLLKYPEGMLREAYADTHKGIKFYLCGEIYGVSSDGIDMAGAVTYEENGFIIIAFNINNSLKYNIPHELSHVFDRRIEYMGAKLGKNFMDDWNAATKVGNAYAYSYNDYYELYEYTFEYEDDEGRIWFIDPYSRTQPTEDRARIFENLFNAPDAYIDYFANEHLSAKARLYCSILRQCFKSCVNPFWEEYLK